MSIDQEFSRLFHEIARGWAQSMPEGAWKEATLFWASVDGTVYPWVTAIDHDGAPHRVELSAEVFRSLFELRSIMADPQKGAWISLFAQLNNEGNFDVRYNWRERFYWGQHAGAPWLPPAEGLALVPSDEDFAAELQNFPRDEEFLPEWYPRPAASAPEVEDQAAPSESEEDSEPAAPHVPAHRFAEELSIPLVVPPVLQPLTAAWGWPGILTTLDESMSQGLSAADDDATAALRGERDEDAKEQQRRIVIEGTARAGMSTILRSNASVAVRLWTEASALIGSGDPGDLSAYETESPAADYGQQPTMSFLLRDLERTVLWITDATVRRRFP